MNNEKIKKILDKTDINVLDEINILEYIYELEKVKEDYIKSLDKLDVLENRNNKAIEYIETNKLEYGINANVICEELEDILRGEDNE